MKPLTLEYAIEHKFTPIDCVKYFKPNWCNVGCEEFLWNFTCYPFSNERMIEQLNQQLIEPEQHTVILC